MATEKPRFSITVSEDMYQKINEYHHKNRFSTQTKAIASLIEKGLERLVIEDSEVARVLEKSPSVDESILEGDQRGNLRTILLENFDQLNEEGQERLVETSDDMVSSGKYIKSDPAGLGKAKNA